MYVLLHLICFDWTRYFVTFIKSEHFCCKFLGRCRQIKTLFFFLFLDIVNVQFCKRWLVHLHAFFLFSLFFPIESKKKSWKFWGNMESILLQRCLVPWSRIQRQTCMNNWSNFPFKIIIVAFEGYIFLLKLLRNSFFFRLEHSY